MSMLTDAERALFEHQHLVRQQDREVELELADEITMVHRPTVDLDLQIAPVPTCAECDEDYPCRRVGWASRRRHAPRPPRATSVPANGHSGDPGTGNQ